MKIELIGAGAPPDRVLPTPEKLTVTVTRGDGYAPNPAEILTALELARESLLPKKSRKKAPASGDE